MLSERTAPVTVLSYGTYDRNGTPMTRRDGSTVERVFYAVEGEDRNRSMTLAASVNGSRVEPGTEAELLVESRQEAVARRGQNGDYVQWVEKRRCIGFVKAAA